MKDYRQFSMWLHGCPGALAPRSALPGPLDVDVVIVGAGLTGLWTAYYLKKADAGLRVVVLERDVAAFGASGRNGGWCSSLFATPKATVAKMCGRSAAVALQRTMYETVDEVARVVREERIDAGFHKGACSTWQGRRRNWSACAPRWKTSAAGVPARMTSRS